MVEITVARARRRFRALVPVRERGDRVPLFCVHGSGGNVLNFHDLSRAMNPAQIFYGLQAWGVDGVSRPHRSIEEMAAAYLAEVREVRPHGPYLLGGYSGGGVVAFEMARLLTTAGAEVGLLALIDTFHPQMSLRRTTVFTRLTRLRDEGMPYIVGALQRRRIEAKLAKDTRTIERHLSRGEPIPFALRELHLRNNFRNVITKYQPKPWPGRALLIRAAEITYELAHVYCEGGPAYGWDRQILGGVEIVAVPGGHHSLILGANAEVVGRSLDAAIERATVSC